MVNAARRMLEGRGFKLARYLAGSLVTSLDMARLLADGEPPGRTTDPAVGRSGLRLLRSTGSIEKQISSDLRDLLYREYELSGKAGIRPFFVQESELFESLTA